MDGDVEERCVLVVKSVVYYIYGDVLRIYSLKRNIVAYNPEIGEDCANYRCQ